MDNKEIENNLEKETINVNNAADNCIEEIKEDYKKNPNMNDQTNWAEKIENCAKQTDKDLTSIAINTKYTLSEIKETYRMVGDIEELSLIIKTAQKTGLKPREIVSLLKDFDKWTK